MSEGKTSQARDRLAELLGWECLGRDGWRGPKDEYLDRTEHPIPDTIDGISKFMPEGWDWSRVEGTWCAFRKDGKGKQDERHVLDTGDEYADRLALLVEVLEPHP